MDMFGRPPNAGMVSSIEIHGDEDKSSRQIELKSSTAEENCHTGE